MALCMSAMAQAAELKVGAVDLARVLEESPQAEAARGALEEEFSPRERELVKIQKSTRQLEERLTRDAAIMSEAERNKAEREILAHKRELKRNQEEFRDDLNFKRNDVLENLQRQVVNTIRQFAKTQHYDLLLAEGFIYMSNRVDVTDQVLTLLQDEFVKAKKQID